MLPAGDNLSFASHELSKQLKRLIEKYPCIAIATAWASANDVFDALVCHKKRIVRAVIGTHFYQTHPEVLEQFVDSTNVRFMLQPDGVFHPKVYVFWNSEAWEIIVGSPNLTGGALTKNSELSVLITSDDGQAELEGEIADIIAGYWDKATTMSQVEADNYRRLWKQKACNLKKVADLFGERPASKPAVQSKVMSMDWARYLAEIKKDKTHGFNGRLELIKEIRKSFKKKKHFNDMPLAVRKGIAGLPNNDIKNWEWFGNMKGSGTFSGLINSEHKGFSLALDQNPLAGNITKKHFDSYIAEYFKTFENGRGGLATATRLLAMKRPDVFLCVDSKNKRKFAEDVGIEGSDPINLERYWDEVVLRIMESPWWQSPEPSDSTEKEIWHARAAVGWAGPISEPNPPRNRPGKFPCRRLGPFKAMVDVP